MKVKDKVKVLGRGWVILVEPDCEIDISDKIICGDNEFEIAGVERLLFVKTVGLVLRPNYKVDDTINVGDEIQVVK